MKILISGAGIAGLSLAYWLKRYGFEPTIVERAPELLVGGYKLDMRGSALDVLRRMGVYDQMASKNTNMQNALLVDKEGKTIEEMDGESFGHRSGDDLEVVREGICRIFHENIHGVEIWFDEVIEDLEQSESGVDVTFKNRKNEHFDLVVGADGLHSKVREIVFGEEKRFLHDLGLYLCVFNAPNYLGLKNQEMQFTEIGRVAQAWSTGDNRKVKLCFAFVSEDGEIPLKDPPAHLRHLNKAFEGLDWVTSDMLAHQPHGEEYYFDKAAQVKMDHFCKGRVALVGDAGYCASPLSGQGTSLAIIGAYVLAGELAKAGGDHRRGFQSYEKELKPFIQTNQRLGQQASDRMTTQGSFISVLTGKIMQTVLNRAPGKVVQWMIHLSSKQIQRAARSIEIKDYTAATKS